MSKSLNLFLPAIGGAALVLGGAYGIDTNIYAEDKVATMAASVEQAKAEAGEIASAAAAKAEAELARVSALEAKALEIQNEARQQLASAGGGAVSEPAPLASDGYGLGRAAMPEEIAAWDVDVLPDGRGLPEGSGDALTGEEVFAEHCASCHGDFAEGVDNWPVLAGGFDTLADKDRVKTVGSYWPHLSTVWDYVHRSMPFGAAQTMSDDDVYAIVAYILYSNDLVDDEFVLSNETFFDVDMPNADGFIVDDRIATEHSLWVGEPCMENCKASVEITRRASDVGVTPADDGTMAESPMEKQLALLGGEEWGAETLAGSVYMGPEPVEVASAEETSQTAADGVALDPALIAAGKSAFKRCSSCHAVGEGAKTRPALS